MQPQILPWVYCSQRKNQVQSEPIVRENAAQPYPAREHIKPVFCLVIRVINEALLSETFFLPPSLTQH